MHILVAVVSIVFNIAIATRRESPFSARYISKLKWAAVFGVSGEVRHKPTATEIVDFGFMKSSEYTYLYRESKGADQLHGYRTADLRLCFCI